MSTRFSDYTSTHQEAIDYFNRLLLDLKLQQMGRTDVSHPIDDERLAEGDKHIRDISCCRKRIIFRD